MAFLKNTALGVGLCAIIAGCGADVTTRAPMSTQITPIARYDPKTASTTIRPWEDQYLRALHERVWTEELIAESRRKRSYGILIDKTRHELFVYGSGELERTLRVELGTAPLLDKERSGDDRTPEGFFRVDRKLDQRTRPKSGYHRFLRIDYPTKTHRAWFSWKKNLGLLPSDALIGSKIGIHGQGADYAPDERSGYDWTQGCIAITNREIEWLYDRAPIGTPVVIVRERMR